ncbi:MAG: hypothetical protein ABSF00_09650 [Candidatus Bathyarchaeia archaeon]|jgi:hypothetical protein
MREKVEKELQHIPRGTFEQNMLRGFFQSLRMNSLGKNAQYHSKEDVLNGSIAALKKQYPNFEPEYDKDSFIEAKR